MDSNTIKQQNTDYILLGIGILLLLIPLALGIFTPESFEKLSWYLRVIAALGGALVAAAIPGILEIKIPGVRAAGAIAVFLLLYRFDPPGAVRNAVHPEARFHKEWHKDYSSLDPPYLVCAVPTIPGHTIAKVSVAGDWRGGTRSGVGPCDRTNGWTTMVVVRDAATKADLTSELYEHVNTVTADTDYEVCLQVTTQPALAIQDTLRFSINEGTAAEYRDRMRLWSCPAP